MSLYNMLFGTNPSADLLLAMLGITRNSVPRFRDCYLNGDCIEIYTRTGGGNRDDYEEENDALHALPGFVSDSDDEFDCTYAHFRFTIPERYRSVCEILRDMGGSRDPGKHWVDLLGKLSNPACKDDPEVVAMLEKMKPLVGKLDAALKGEGPPIIEV
jgi:hypothetical protein